MKIKHLKFKIMTHLKNEKTGKAMTKHELAYAIHHLSNWDYHKSLPYYIYQELYTYSEMAEAYKQSGATYKN